MFMIVAFHMSYKGRFDFAGESLLINKLWLQFTGKGESLGYVGNDIFVLISGYFLINSNKIKFKHVFNLWLQLVFYSALFVFATALFGTARISFGTVIKMFLPLITRRWWFISYYVMLYLIHPILNDILNDLTRASYKKFIVMLVAIWSVFLLFNDKMKMLHLVDFLCIYTVGGYIRLWADDKGTPRYILSGLAFMLINFVVISFLNNVGLHEIKLSGDRIYLVKYLHAMSGIFNMPAAVCMFMGFKSLNIPASKFINTAASAVTGVYLLHDHRITAGFLWTKLFRVSSFQHSIYLIPYMLLIVLAVYILGTIIDLFRAKIFEAISGDKLS